MTAYFLRRLLLMVPTFLGILIINFVVLRFQGVSLTEALSATATQGEGAGERNARMASQRYETYIDRFRRTGNDLPAAINLHGFLTTDAVLRQLTIADPANGRPYSERNQAEKSLWLVGSFAVQPLAGILRRDDLAPFHGPASQALVLCAYTTVNPRDLQRLTNAELETIRARNDRLRDLAIRYRNDEGKPFATDDPKAEVKRRALLAIVDDPANAALYSQDGRWGALLFKTGFTDFLRRLATGDLYSETKKEYVFTVIADRWQTTCWLNLSAILIAWVIAVPLGIRSARRNGTLSDRWTTNSLFALYSVPSFVVGTLLLHHFCTSATGSAAWFPNKGLSSDGSLWYSTPGYLVDALWHAALPLITLSYASFVALSRYQRGNLLEQLGADYVRTARAKGADEDQLVYRHAWRNSSITLITLSSGLLAELFGGVLIVELVFSIPGLGLLLLDAAKQGDAPLIMGSTVVSVGLLLAGILVADLLYAVADPRIRSRYA